MKDEQKRREEEEERVSDRQPNEQASQLRKWFFSFPLWNSINQQFHDQVSDGRESPSAEPLGFQQDGRCSPSNQVNIDVDDE